MQRWVLTVEKQHRLRLTPEIVARIPWLVNADGPVTVLALLNEHGGIRILPPNSSHHKRHEQIAKRVSAAADEEENLPGVLSLARHAANTASVTFSKDRRRISVVIPREMRAQGAPSKGEDAVIFVYGDKVEIWHAERWETHLRSIEGKHEDLVEESADDLGIEDI